MWLIGALTRLHDIVAQIAVVLPGGLRHLLDGHQRWSQSRRKDVEMHLHENGVASGRCPDRTNGDDVIVASIIWSDSDGFQPIAKLGSMGAAFSLSS